MLDTIATSELLMSYSSRNLEFLGKLVNDQPFMIHILQIYIANIANLIMRCAEVALASKEWLAPDNSAGEQKVQIDKAKIGERSDSPDAIDNESKSSCHMCLIECNKPRLRSCHPCHRCQSSGQHVVTTLETCALAYAKLV